MKILKTASGKKSIKLSKKEWQSIGKKAGWGLGSTPDDWEKDERGRQEKDERDAKWNLDKEELPQDLGITVTDNFGNKYKVKIDDSKYGKVVRFYDPETERVVGGGWSVDTIKETKSDKIYIDMGQNWYASNMLEVVKKLKERDNF